MTKHFVLNTYCESDELPQHESIEFCLCYRFPIDLQALRHSGQLSSNDLAPRRKKAVFFTPSEIGKKRSHQLRNVAHMSHNSKLKRDIAPLVDGVKKKVFCCVVTNRGRKVFHCDTTLPNRLKMDSRDKIRWNQAAVADQTRNRR